MRNKSKLLTGIVAGAAAGAVIMLLLNTKGGKQLVSEVKDAAQKALRGWTNAATEAMEASNAA